jgi:hypothetical protein
MITDRTITECLTKGQRVDEQIRRHWRGAVSDFLDLNHTRARPLLAATPGFAHGA